MFQQVKPKSNVRTAFSIMMVIYHSTVRDVRAGHSNAFISLALSIFQSLTLVVAFYAMFSLLGLKGAKVRGDFVLYIMSGIFMYMTHVKAVSSVMGASDPTSAMMQHAPMTTAVSILSAALSSLYIQTLALFFVLFGYHTIITPFVIEDPVSSFALFLLAWGTGVAVGLVFFALKPWFPTFTSMASTVYRRIQMFASGKMFVANSLPAAMIAMFDWNPLFHIIDQVRGYMFVNYFPRNSTWEYPLYVMFALIMIGLMGEFYTRQQASSSWAARR